VEFLKIRQQETYGHTITSKKNTWNKTLTSHKPTMTWTNLENILIKTYIHDLLTICKIELYFAYIIGMVNIVFEKCIFNDVCQLPFLQQWWTYQTIDWKK